MPKTTFAIQGGNNPIAIDAHGWDRSTKNEDHHPTSESTVQTAQLRKKRHRTYEITRSAPANAPGDQRHDRPLLTCQHLTTEPSTTPPRRALRALTVFPSTAPSNADTRIRTAPSDPGSFHVERVSKRPFQSANPRKRPPRRNKPNIPDEGHRSKRACPYPCGPFPRDRSTWNNRTSNPLRIAPSVEGESGAHS